MTFSDWTDIYCGNALEVLAQLPEKSVQCVVTSPPYWGLRRYSGEQTVCFSDGEYAFGLEPTPELYIAHSMEFMKAIWRVLKDDGVVWINLGDSYAGSNNGSNDYRGDDASISSSAAKYQGQKPGRASGLKPLDLCLIPYRFALAAQADGWYVRSDVIWNKPNPMPESVNSIRWERHKVKVKEASNYQIRDKLKCRTNTGLADCAVWQDCPGCDLCNPHDGYVLRKGSWRPTTTHEYIFLLTKSDDYYSDIEAVREPAQQWGTRDRGNGKYRIEGLANGLENDSNPSGRNLRSVWTMNTEPFGLEMCKKCKRIYDRLPSHRTCSCGSKEWLSHFATFPSEIPRKAILASTSEKGNCSKCGKPVVRVVESKSTADWETRKLHGAIGGCLNRGSGQQQGEGMTHDLYVETQTLGWKPSCQCCRKCDIMGLQPNERRIAHALQRPREREAIQSDVEECQISERRRMAKDLSFTKAEISQDLSVLPEGIQGENTRREILQPEVFPKVDVAKQIGESLSINEARTQLSEQMDRGQGNEDSPNSNGETSRQTTIAQRIGSSYQRGQKRQSVGELGYSDKTDTRIESYHSSQKHELEPYPAEPCIVLDPFAGSGTTGIVAKQLGRRSILIDMSEDYCRLMRYSLARISIPMSL